MKFSLMQRQDLEIPLAYLIAEIGLELDSRGSA